MIATILPKSATFHAIMYNEKKVAEGSAVLIEKRNISGAAAMPGYTAEDMRDFFNEYSSRNSRIKYPQYHVAISCKGNEYTHEELTEFAHKYLDEMGYGDPRQPLLIYAHTDTDNTHIHIVTSRVAPDGKKIGHSHERRRALETVEKLMQQDRKSKVDNDIASAWEYSFNDIGGFQVIMQSKGYECYRKKDTDKVYVKYGGVIQRELAVSDIESHFRKHTHPVNDDEHKKGLQRRSRQLYDIFNKYKHTCSSLDEFAEKMRKQFGVSLVFMGNKDNPTSYRIVDHEKKAVFYPMIAIPTLRKSFKTYDDRLKLTRETINKMLTDNPSATSKEINEALYRDCGTYINDYAIVIDNKKEKMDDSIVEKLKNNNKAAWQRGHPSQHASAASSGKQQPKTLNIGGSGQSASTTNRDWEVGGGADSDDLEEQMKRQMKL